MTDNGTPTLVSKAFRTVCASIDKVIYFLLGLMYQIFFNVASADIFSMESVLGFYKRVQLIIGVYMVFHLAVLIMKGIFNTDTVSGKNNNEFIKKIIIALTMLTVLTPVNIPNAQNEYEKQINNNGLLFGTLYSLQNRILSNNTIGRLVLGTNDTFTTSGTTYKEITDRDEQLEKAANTFSNTILKGFVRINLVPKKDRKATQNGEAPETLNENRMCRDIDDNTRKVYLTNDTEPGEILDLVNGTCVPSASILPSPINKALSFFGLSNKTKYAFAYMPIVSGAVGIVFIFLLISFTIDIAVRAIKLSVLRLIAPIPIISYMDPNGSKDSGFNSWVKTLTQTYLDLFIRLAVVYFVIFLIQDMIANGIYMNYTNDAIGVLSFIFICIGLFMFAKEAPKFFQQAIGMKNEPGNFFGKALGRTAALAGFAGSFNASRIASREADITNHGEAHANRLLNRGKHLLTGMAGGIAGLGAGLSAAEGAKDHAAKAAFEAQAKRNAMDIQRGKNGSTFMGRNITMADRLIRGQDAYERESAKAKVARAQEKTAKDLFSYLSGKGALDGSSYKTNTSFDIKDANGNVIDTKSVTNTSYDEFKNAWEKAKVERRNNPNVTTFSIGGSTFEIDGAMTQKMLDEISYSAGTQWAAGQDALIAAGSSEADVGYKNKKEDFATVGGSFDASNPDAVSKLKKAYKKAGGEADHIERSKAYMQHEADHGATGGKK